jgi:hypothetical protein
MLAQAGVVEVDEDEDEDEGAAGAEGAGVRGMAFDIRRCPNYLLFMMKKLLFLKII